MNGFVNLVLKQDFIGTILVIYLEMCLWSTQLANIYNNIYNLISGYSELDGYFKGISTCKRNHIFQLNPKNKNNKLFWTGCDNTVGQELFGFLAELHLLLEAKWEPLAALNLLLKKSGNILIKGSSRYCKNKFLLLDQFIVLALGVFYLLWLGSYRWCEFFCYGRANPLFNNLLKISLQLVNLSLHERLEELITA